MFFPLGWPRSRRSLRPPLAAKRWSAIDVDASSSVVKAGVGKATKSVKPGESKQLALTSQTVVAETVSYSESENEIQGLPEHRWGREKTFSPKPITVEPAVNMRHTPELDIVKISR